MATYRYATKDLSITNAEAFISAMNASDGRNASDKKSIILYAVLGRTLLWPDENTPETPPDNEQYLHYEAHRNFIGGKKITTSDVSHVVPRYNWEYGTTYSMYRDTDVDMYERQHYVLTEELNVYKCLFNAKNSPSLVKPTGYSILPFTTSDGYTWKYLYTISLGEANKFLTPSHMPVKTLVSDDGSSESSRQLAVQNAAVNGSIEIVEINSGGVGYQQYANGVVEAGGVLSLKLSSAGSNPPSAIDAFYTGDSVYVISGTGAGQLRRIINYEGSTKTLFVNTAFTTVCNVDSRVIISPTITLVGDGSGALAYSYVNEQTGAIANVQVIEVGSSYTTAKAYITSNNDYGYGASANVIISPVGGHGSNPIRELHADKVMLNVQFRGSEGISANGNGYVPANTEFRSVSILKDPVLKCDANNNFVATEYIANTSNSPSTLRFTHRIKLAYLQLDGTTPTNVLNVNDIVTNSDVKLKAETGELEFVTELNQDNRRLTSLTNAVRAANATIAYIRRDETESDPFFYTMYINNVNTYNDYRIFTRNQSILRSDSVEEIATVEEIKGPEANTFSGEIIFTENLQAVERDVSQIEDIKIILDF